MKLKLACILFFAVCTTHAFSQSDEKKIRNVMLAQVQAWNKGDIDAFMQTYWQSDSLVFIGSKGPVYGWKSTLERYKKSYPDTATMGKLDFDILSVRVLSNQYAYVTGKWHLARSVGDIGGYYTLLFRKVNGKWVIIEDHTS